MGAGNMRREGVGSELYIPQTLSFLLSFHLLLAPPTGHAQLEARGLEPNAATRASLWARAQARSGWEGARGALKVKFRCQSPGSMTVSGPELN